MVVTKDTPYQSVTQTVFPQGEAFPLRGGLCAGGTRVRPQIDQAGRRDRWPNEVRLDEV